MSKTGMLDQMQAHAATARDRHKTDALDYRLVFSICFVVFFWVLAIERIVPSRWRHISDPSGAKSLMAEAKEAAHGCAGIAFQG